MSWNSLISEPTSEWGGPWTEKKLDTFVKYVSAYLKILKRHDYETVYFDGFVGSGSKEKKLTKEQLQKLKFEEFDDYVYKGAAERVLAMDSEFDYYQFIDKNQDSLDKLKSKLEEKNLLKGKEVEFKPGDANEKILEFASVIKNKDKYAALVLLDPFGMQINWESIRALNKTRSDIWILVPTGMIVNRLMDKDGNLKYIDKLEKFFGLSEKEIREIFYTKKVVSTLFGEQEYVSKVSDSIEKIAEIYVKQLSSVWKHVSPKPLRLNNRNGAPLFHFVFASNNSTALKIANQIIDKN